MKTETIIFQVLVLLYKLLVLYMFIVPFVSCSRITVDYLLKSHKAFGHESSL